MEVKINNPYLLGHMVNSFVDANLSCCDQNILCPSYYDIPFLYFYSLPFSVNLLKLLPRNFNEDPICKFIFDT